jgi:hypothetical protein
MANPVADPRSGDVIERLHADRREGIAWMR